MKDAQARVTAVVIMHGNRWKFLSQMIPAVLKDEHITKLIIVDNGSENKKEIEEGTRQYGNRVTILRVEKNLGSAGGFALGIEEARKVDADYVYLSDDDMVPEDNFVNSFLEARALFGDFPVILCGHRVDMPGNSLLFRNPKIVLPRNRKTFFEIFSTKKVLNFFSILFSFTSKRPNAGEFFPLVPVRGFVYGGTFLPIDAVRRAPLPDASLFLYGDDLAYAWRVEELGYHCYATASPIIRDVDLTFSGSHITGLFLETTSNMKVYYRIRNMIRISLEQSEQSRFELNVSVAGWITGLLVIGLFHIGPTRKYLSRARLILDAVRAGYDRKRALPAGV